MDYAADKRYIYIYQLLSNVKLPGSNIFDFQMKMYTGNRNIDVSLAKESQKPDKRISSKMVSLIRSNKKIFMKRKWIDRQYHVQYNANVAHTDLIMYCNKNKSPALTVVVHIPTLMAQWGWVRIIIFVLIQN